MLINRFENNNNKYFVINNTKKLEITFCDFGASIYSIRYDKKLVTYAPESLDEFETTTKHYGKSLGRVCGRLKDGLINIDGKDYQLEVNNNGNTLHGGFHNLSFQRFNYLISEDDNEIIVTFKYLSKDLECGFPGDLDVTITYKISKKEDSFNIHFYAKPNKTTVVNMSSHIYWRLTGKDILDHELCINADKNTEPDDKLITIGCKDITPLFDFRKPKLIGKDIFEVAKNEPAANGYDHGFVFIKGEKPLITLKHNHIKLSITTNMDMVNVYANCYPIGGPIKEYGDDILYGGVAIEPQMYFNSYKNLICDESHPYDHYLNFKLEDY